jgi:DNA end-binding protein Ku
MRRTNKAGLAKFVLAEREYLVAVTSREGVLALTTLHYRDEILPDDDISLKKETVGAEEEGRIKGSIKKMLKDFNPGKYADDRRKRLVDLLAAKVKEKTPVEAPVLAEEEGEGPADLVAALEESMRKVKENR